MNRSVALLEQGQKLTRCAVKRTGDVNEAYLLVHGVMAQAFKAGGAVNLDSALINAFKLRAALANRVAA